jgi:hypothetical protein
MNLKRGLSRIWIIASLCWLAGWFVYVWRTCTQPVELEITYCYTNLFSVWQAPIHHFTIWHYTYFILSAISVPIAMLIIGLAVWWVVSGFRA